MGQEIERKFLVNKKLWEQIEKPKSKKILQGYMVSSAAKTIRIRIQEKDAFLTIKGKTNGITRPEFEYDIPLNDANELLNNFCGKYIEKERFLIEHKGHFWEVDVFHQPNKGLILAEVELDDEKEQVILPNWIEKEVSSDPRYFNANMLE
jgi:CYTH domain-containing protein